MSAIRFRLTPVDTLFFRDSRPFEKRQMQSDAESQFPAPARTVAGALRLALARGNGFDGRGSWSGALAAVLGDGPDDLGALRFRGPFVARDGEPLYPLPAHVLGERKGAGSDETFSATTRLAPGQAVWCDLGEVRLPAPVTANTALGSGAGFFVRKKDLEAVLAGGLPGSVVSPRALYALEPRIGLARDGARRTALAEQLYASTHLRLREGVSVVVEVEGVPAGWAERCPRLIALGGESRMAELEAGGALPSIVAPAREIERTRRVTVTLLSPLRMTDATMPKPGGTLAGLPGARVVSACLGKPLLLGGWDSRRREPLPLRPYVPAGSTWFCTLDAGREAAVIERHGKSIDESEGALGFGAVALGTWKEI